MEMTTKTSRTVRMKTARRRIEKIVFISLNLGVGKTMRSFHTQSNKCPHSVGASSELNTSVSFKSSVCIESGLKRFAKSITVLSGVCD